MTIPVSHCDNLSIAAIMVTKYRNGEPKGLRNGMQDWRSYSKTAKPLGDDPTIPQRDQYDDRIAWWFGKRIYLGRDSRIARLFWFLAKHLGKSCFLYEIQVEQGEGMVDDLASEEARRADQRLRQDLSRLRKELAASRLDDHVIIHRENTLHGPALTMMRRDFAKFTSASELQPD